MSLCAICEKPSDEGMNRVGGADVCEPCIRGLAPYVIRDQRGWDFEIQQWDRVTDEGERIYYTDAKLNFGRATSLQFKARRKTLGYKLLNIVKPSIKTGDRLFDGHVYVQTKTPGTVRPVMEDDGVQSILMDMLGEGSWIQLNGNLLRSYSVRRDYVEEARFSSEMCVLASHVMRLGA